MRDEEKTQEELIRELGELRQEITELKVKVSENKVLQHILATLVENLSEGIVVTDFNGQIIYVNKSTERYTGYSRHELIGGFPGILNREKDADTIQQEIVTTMQRSGRWCGDLCQKRNDGSTYLAEFEIFPVIQEDGTLIAWASIQRDITKRKQVETALQESEIKYRTLVEQIPAITYVAANDEASTTSYVSPQVEKLLGFSQDDYKADPDTWRKQIHPDYRERVLADVARCHTSKERFISEYRMFARDGRVLWFRDEAVVIRDETGQSICLQGVMLDITERKRMEEALQESEARLRRITNNMLDMICQTNAEGIIEYISPSHKSILGYEPEDMLGKSILDFVHPDDIKRVMTAMRTAIDSVSPGKIEYRLRHTHGHYLWLETIGNLLLNDNGLTAGATFCTRDITERKQAEEALWESQKSYAALLSKHNKELTIINEQLQQEITERKRIEVALEEQLQILELFFRHTLSPIAILDRDFNFIRVNEAYAKADEREVHDFSGCNHFDFYPSDAKAIFEQVVETKIPYQAFARPFTYPDHPEWGTTYWDWTLVPVLDSAGEVRLLIFSLNNVTMRKRAEEALDAERQRLFSVLDGLPVLVYLQAPDYSIRFSNHYFMKSFGKPKDRPCYEILHGHKEPCKECPTFRVFHTKSPQNWEGALPNNAIYQFYVYPFSDIDGSPLVLVLGIDITERKLAEEAQRLSMERFQKIFNASPSLLSIRSVKDDRYMDVNESWLNHMGYRREEVIGHIPEEFNFDVDPFIGTKRRKRSRRGAIRNEEFRYRKKSGEERVGLISTNIIDIAGEKSILAEIRDITELKRLENEMARLERLNLVGEMAAGIGHEIRNPMTAVRGFLQMLGSKEECAKYKDYYDLMIEELDRANSIITEFLSLAKNKPVNLELKNLNLIVKALSPLITADATNSNINILVELEDIPDLPLNEKEIRQLILNLVKNGLEAMGHGGKLTIRTFKDNGKVVLSVQDQGPGIKPELMDKIGTPFFTTKEKGTGLGLAVCYGIAARHNAAIAIDTCPAGTTFFVRFKL